MPPYLRGREKNKNINIVVQKSIDLVPVYIRSIHSHADLKK